MRPEVPELLGCQGQSENKVRRPPETLEDTEQQRVTVYTLLPHTAAPKDGYLLLWDGWGNAIPPTLRSGAQVPIFGPDGGPRKELLPVPSLLAGVCLWCRRRDAAS